jgi:hypothetical protein
LQFDYSEIRNGFVSEHGSLLARRVEKVCDLT